MSQLAHKLAQITTNPGVYKYFDANGNLLYIGKAKNLKKRVSSYFTKKHQSPWTELLVQEIADVEVIEVKTELEALMLENSLVKSLRPKYNIQLKDDKTFPFLRISNDELPEFSIVRRVKNDRARYLGPYLSATYIRSMLKLLQSLYGVRTSSKFSYESRSNVPIEIGLGARNLDNISKYREHVESAIRFLSSPQPQMEREIKRTMHYAAQNQEFERAAILRDRLRALEQLRSSQSLFGTSTMNRDYLGIARVGKLVCVYLIFEREGKITDSTHFTFELPTSVDTAELTSAAITYLYIQGLPLPATIELPELPHDAQQLMKLLSEQHGRKVTLHVPQRGDLKERLQRAIDNAHYQIRLESHKKQRREHGLADLARILQLPKPPKRIEAFDISNLGATHIVGASIVFIDGQPAKKEYRKYTIHTPEGQDDFASMRELVYRRVSNKERSLPDLLLIDGGKGQLSAAVDAIRRAQVAVPLVSLAKREELLFLPNQSEPITLSHDSDALLLLMAMRDEVHRFVITFHRQKRSKRLTQ